VPEAPVAAQAGEGAVRQERRMRRERECRRCRCRKPPAGAVAYHHPEEP